jgi:glyoxylase-like metal-dependent hydrolase (beta-lactamase superfamily II)
VSTRVAPSVATVRDTCNVYVLRSGGEAVLVDIGSGDVLDRLDELDVDRVTDVLVTHHHRDQVQGLGRAAAAGIRIWVPPVERGLIEDVDEHWRTRQLDNDYDLRDDRFSLRESVRVTGTVDEYRTRRYGAFDVFTLPTPGHTVGSVTYLVDLEGRRLAFTGDLLHAGGKVWSLAATQWTYSGLEGQTATSLSCALLADREPDVILPAHGPPIEDPAEAIALTRARLEELIELRRGAAWNSEDWLRNPWVQLTPHLWRSRTSFATAYALRSESGHTLLVDWGYDLWTGNPSGSDRSARRPLLATLEGLDVEVVVPTHYHDDHVAGINLLRDVQGTQAWVPANVAPILADPARHDLPCLWFDPVPADRVLPLGEPVAWREYELTAYALAGHTRYAAAIAFEVDGKRVLATGDQQTAAPDALLNYQYRNRFDVEDYVRSAELYATLRPDLILTGHWGEHPVDAAFLDRVRREGRQLADLHARLLPEGGLGAEGFVARIEPYRSTADAGGTVRLEVAVDAAPADVRLAVPDGWTVEPREAHLEHPGIAVFRVAVGPEPAHRARVAADVTVDGVRYGEQAEALVDVR